MENNYNEKNEHIEKRYLEIEHYGSKLKESIRAIDKVDENGYKILARRGKDDRPQDYDSKKKVKILSKRRTIRKNLNDLI
jgi:hypothetical protein